MGFFSNDGAAQLSQAKLGSAADVEAAKKYNPFGNFLTGLSKVGSKAFTNTDNTLDARAMDPFQAKAAELSSGKEFRDNRADYVRDVNAIERLDQTQKTKLISDYDAQKTNVDNLDAITSDRLQGAAREGIGNFNNKQGYGQSVYDSYIDAGMTGAQALAAQKTAESEFFNKNNQGVFSQQVQGIGNIDFRDPVAVQQAKAGILSMPGLTDVQRTSLTSQIDSQSVADQQKRTQVLNENVVGLDPSNYSTKEQFLDSVNQLGVNAGRSQAELNEMRANAETRWGGVAKDAVSNFTTQTLANARKEGLTKAQATREFNAILDGSNLSATAKEEALKNFDAAFLKQRVGTLSPENKRIYEAEQTSEATQITNTFDSQADSVDQQFARALKIEPRVMKLNQDSVYTADDGKALGEIYGDIPKGIAAVSDLRQLAADLDISLTDNEMKNLAVDAFDGGDAIDEDKAKRLLAQIAVVKKNPEVVAAHDKVVQDIRNQGKVLSDRNFAANLINIRKGNYKDSPVKQEELLKGVTTPKQYFQKVLNDPANVALRQQFAESIPGYEPNYSEKQKVENLEKALQRAKEAAEAEDAVTGRRGADDQRQKGYALSI